VTTPTLDLRDYDFTLPAASVAQRPPPAREDARLFVLRRTGGADRHLRVADLPDQIATGDLVVVNATRVLPARLRGRKASGGHVEALVLGAAGSSPDRYRALVRRSGRLRAGHKLVFGGSVEAEVVGLGEAGEVELAFAPGMSPYGVGEAPLPPYIERSEADPYDLERYQTVYARVPGAIAAPTAGLHLSPAVLDSLAERGVEYAEVVLHVGPGTFRGLAPADLERGTLHPERYELLASTAEAIERTRARGGRVIAVGTTTARVLETCARPGGRVTACAGATELFLRPGSRFAVVDGLLTNFHLPRSSLLLLVAAFAGRERVLDAYAEALRRGYRFYSYGDAMLIL
jgi:S-adenosylmethionine:tRNA ribosyltransferase-isomerase